VSDILAEATQNLKWVWLLIGDIFEIVIIARDAGS
jgi:hypothetical protein